MTRAYSERIQSLLSTIDKTEADLGGTELDIGHDRCVQHEHQWQSAQQPRDYRFSLGAANNRRLSLEHRKNFGISSHQRPRRCKWFSNQPSSCIASNRNGVVTLSTLGPMKRRAFMLTVVPGAMS